MGVYATITEVRAEADVPDVAPPSDADVEALITRAEDQIDEWLGLVPINPATGRKIVQSSVDAWRWTKLKRATVRLTARLHADPNLLKAREWEEVSGPDFTTKGPLPGLAQLSDVTAPLNASGLRRLSARATA